MKSNLKLELHQDKSRIISVSRGVDFVGFKNFYYFRLLRKRNIKNIFSIINKYKQESISKEKLLEQYQGWEAYAKWANTYVLRDKIIKKISLLQKQKPN